MTALKMIVFLLLPCLMGEGALSLFYGKKRREVITRTDSVLIGWILVIGLAEVAHLFAVVLGRPFSDCVKLFLVGMAFLSLASAVILYMAYRREKFGSRAKCGGHAMPGKNAKRGARHHRSGHHQSLADLAEEREANRLHVKKLMTTTPSGTAEKVIYFIFAVLAILQILMVVTGGKVYPTGDMTVEAVGTILSTDTVYQINPMTGSNYMLGVPMRLKILCLPTLYAIFCEIFSISAVQLLWTAVPAVVLLGTYLAYDTVARALFPEDGKKRGIFLIFVVLLLWAGNYLYGMDGFAVQHAGFRGVSIRMAVLLPYTFGLILRKKWCLLPLCILAEACIVWTLYGMGACFFVTAAMILPGVLRNVIARLHGGKEDDRCRN